MVGDAPKNWMQAMRLVTDTNCIHAAQVKECLGDYLDLGVTPKEDKKRNIIQPMYTM